MIRYRYASDMNPPAPFVLVSLRDPPSRSVIEGIPAQIDTAADRSVIPQFIVNDLELLEDDRLQFQGFAGSPVELPIFLVEVCLHDLEPFSIRVVSSPSEQFILLGRDVLNRLNINLFGPTETLEIRG